MVVGHIRGHRYPFLLLQYSPFLFKARLSKGMGKKVRQPSLLFRRAQAYRNDAEPGSKLRQHLKTGPAGRGRCRGRREQDQGRKIPVTLRYGPYQGNPFGTEGEAVRGIFDVATGDDDAVGCQQGGADGKTAVGTVAVLHRRSGSFFKRVLPCREIRAHGDGLSQGRVAICG